MRLGSIACDAEARGERKEEGKIERSLSLNFFFILLTEITKTVYVGIHI